MAASMSSRVANLASYIDAAWFRKPNNKAFAMNPALSPATTGFLPSRFASARTSSITSGAVTTVRITSTKACTGAGLKKCMPTTRSGCAVADEISVTESEDVLVARIAFSPTISSSRPNTRRLRSSCSTTASTTRSQLLTSSRAVVNDTRSNSSCCPSASSLPRLTARSVECWRCCRPRSSESSSRSTPTTSKPLRANTSTMPAPIVPRPMTPMLVKSRLMIGSLTRVSPGPIWRLSRLVASGWILHGPDRAEGRRAQRFRALGQVVDVAAADRLPAPRVDDSGPGDHLVADRRPDEAQLVLRGQDRRPEHRPAGEGQGVVGQVGHDAAMGQTELLAQLRPNRQPQLRRPGLERDQLGAEQRVERLLGQDRASDLEHLGRVAVLVLTHGRYRRPSCVS